MGEGSRNGGLGPARISGIPRKQPPRRLVTCVAAALLLFACVAAWALDWPLSPVRVAATFGTPARGRFIAGTALAADNALVRALAEGELSFSFEEGSHPSGLPSALGSFAVVEHGHDIAAVYAHLASGSISSYLKTVKAESILGKTGSSGWTEGPGLLLQIFDRRLDQWLNPLLVLPPSGDDKAPVIRSMALVRGTRSYVLGEVPSLPQGSYMITVDVADPSDSPWTAGPLAPLSIRLTMDGAEIAREVFDVAEGKEGHLLLFSRNQRDFAGYRTREGRYVLGERLMTRGKVVFEASAEDASGNRRTVSWSVVVE